MSVTQPNEAAIREKAYLLWEADGKPFGHDNEYWSRATIALGDKAVLEMVSKPAPKRAKADAVVAPKAGGKPKAAPKLRAAASKSKAAPAKSGKTDDKKPKKK